MLQVATIGRVGWGAVSQVLSRDGGVRGERRDSDGLELELRFDIMKVSPWVRVEGEDDPGGVRG